jgi:small multidrug resistance pump
MLNKLLFIPVVLSYSLPTFIFKDLTKYFNNYEIIVLYHLIYHIFIFTALLFIIMYDKKPVIEFVRHTNNLPGKLKILMGAIVALGLISQYAYFQLLRGIDVNTLLTIVRGASTVLVMIIGYFIYKENLTPVKILGIFLVITGIIIVNSY